MSIFLGFQTTGTRSVMVLTLPTYQPSDFLAVIAALAVALLALWVDVVMFPALATGSVAMGPVVFGLGAAIYMLFREVCHGQSV